MIFDGYLKKSFFLSLTGHLALFFLLGISFGRTMPRRDYAQTSFWGGILRPAEFMPYLLIAKDKAANCFKRTMPVTIDGFNPSQKTLGFNPRYECKLIFAQEGAADRPRGSTSTKHIADLNDLQAAQTQSGIFCYRKPPADLSQRQDKLFYIYEERLPQFIKQAQKPVIILHPSLPQYFLIYFKDRQLAHIELLFNMPSVPSGKRTSRIEVKRKITSGNLEADLLSMRYISHYLFIQQSAFPSDTWQTVEIDLSCKDDKN